MDTRVDAYVREEGAICYQLPLFYQRRDVARGLTEELRKTIFGCGLTWCWESIGSAVGHECEPDGGVSSRRLSILSTDTLPDFVHDLESIDEEDWVCDLTLFGFDNGAERFVIDPYDLNLRKALEHFVVYEAGPIRIAIVIGTNCVYVPHLPVPAVQAMLEEWNVRPSNLRKHRYRHLHLGMPSIEELYALPLPREVTILSKLWESIPRLW